MAKSGFFNGNESKKIAIPSRLNQGVGHQSFSAPARIDSDVFLEIESGLGGASEESSNSDASPLKEESPTKFEVAESPILLVGSSSSDKDTPPHHLRYSQLGLEGFPQRVKASVTAWSSVARLNPSERAPFLIHGVPYYGDDAQSDVSEEDEYKSEGCIACCRRRLGF